ncbi:ABC transporter ATP-binding protein [Noviherbaspirillum pedocola]|uniref:ABC transporter ATP-binding protein n=1 Tax=Noviherbaspirillum pedocola TaxID=2801341 RepID=A0A934T0J2_9BURK|nr:ABC transporter ATP-binding protein [Noviherbaspirillum pedocola]MBK4736274.1 ABC transporter ATP-binding protein [Noviherbaspirillum pedocola]
MLRAHDLRLCVSEHDLVRGLDWRMAPGECWVILGRNGAGKSTLLRTIAGLQPPRAGKVELEGRAIDAWPALELARRRAFLPQSQGDAFGFRVLDAVLVARHPYREAAYWDSDADRARGMAALALTDVAHLAERDLRTLSGGERQRVAIAATLAQDTPLLLLDEPAAALDLPHQVGIMSLLARLCRERGRAVAMVAHDLNLVEGVASHALLLMGDGAWRAGTFAEMMRPELVSACLGHCIDVLRHGGRTVFLPARD